MTPLEDRVREALAGKAREFPPDAVPPLRLPAPAPRPRPRDARNSYYICSFGSEARCQCPSVSAPAKG